MLNEINQIDNELVCMRPRSLILDVNTRRGPNCISDHYLVQVKVREKIIKTRKTEELWKRWNIDALKSKEGQQEYQRKIHNMIEEL